MFILAEKIVWYQKINSQGKYIDQLVKNDARRVLWLVFINLVLPYLS